MAADLVRVVDTVRDDLKKSYIQDPSLIWGNPVVFISQSGGKAGYMKPDADKDLTEAEEEKFMIDWMKQFRNDRSVEAVVVGRMVVKYNGILDSNGNKMISERAILVSGRSFIDGRTRISITPVKEHRDYRQPETIATEATPLNPGLESPDTTKLIMAGDMITGILIGQFQPEQIMDSRDGVKCVMDPLIEGVFGSEFSVGGV
jgi:hypothetical protein